MLEPLTNWLGEWVSTVNVASVLLRLVLSVVFGAVIGWERSIKRHAAGLRTYILASLSTTGAVIADQVLNHGNGTSFDFISGAALIAVAIISVNSVLYSSKNQIKGLTTSMGLCVSSVVGLILGAGLYTVGLFAFLALMMSMALFPKLERALKDRSNHFEIHIELTNPSYLKEFVTTLRKLGIVIDDIEMNPAYAGSGLSVYSVAVTVSSQELKKYKSHAEIIKALKTIDYLYHIEEIH